MDHHFFFPTGLTPRRRLGRAGAGLLLAAALLVSGFGPAPAARAAAVNVACSDTALIAAIAAANATPADDTLNLAAGCQYVLALVNNTTQGANGLPVIVAAASGGRLTLNGHGATIMRGFRLWLPLVATDTSPRPLAGPGPRAASSAGDTPDFRLLLVASGGSLTLDSLTLQNGSLPGNDGGALYNAGALTVTHSTLTGNAAGFGGGIYNAGTLAVSQSTFTDNTADGAGGGINSSGALTVTGSTFAANSAGLGDSLVVAAGSASVTGSTIPNGTTFTCPAFPDTVAAGDTAGLISALGCANSLPSDDVIDLTNSTYTLTVVDNSTYGDTGLPIIAPAAAAGALTLHGHGATIARDSAGGTPEFRLLVVDSGAHLALDSLTLQNGRLTQNLAGGLFNMGTLQITASTLVSNTAIFGGGLVNGGLPGAPGTATLSNITFLHNAASGSGGGFFSFVGSVDVSASTFLSNTAVNDGGGFGSQAAVTVRDSAFTDNLAAYGGGLSSRPGGGVLTVSHSTFVSNTTRNDGAGLNSGGVLTVMDSLFTHNYAAGLGGGMVVGYGPATISATMFISNSAYGAAGGAGMLVIGGPMTVTDSLFTDNYADGAGGAFFNAGGDVRLSNSTLVNNTAWADGGALYSNGTLTVTHSTIAHNFSNVGGHDFNGGGGLVLWGGTAAFGNTLIAGNVGLPGPDINIVSGTVVSLGYNLIGDTTNVTLTGTTTGNLTGAAAGPLNLGPLQNNGGPTLTQALLPGSVAIDHGDPGFAPPPAYDQRGPGYPRVLNGRLDIGAYEK